MLISAAVQDEAITLPDLPDVDTATLDPAEPVADQLRLHPELIGAVD